MARWRFAKLSARALYYNLDESNGWQPDPDHIERHLEHISPREIGNAMFALCGAAAGMTTEQLWSGTLEVFGFTRRSAAQLSRLEEALDLVLTNGRLIRRGDGVLIASR